MTSSPSESSVRADWRLAVPAVAVWALTWWGIGADPEGLGVAAAGAGSVTAILVGWTVACRARRRDAGSPAAVTGAILTLAVVASAAAMLSVRVGERVDGPVAQLAHQNAAAVVDLVVTSDPRPTSRFGGVVVSARAESVARHGSRIRVSVPVLIMAGSSWDQVRWGARYQVAGVLRAPQDTADGYAAVLAVRTPPTEVQQPGWLWRAAERTRTGLRTACEPLPATAAGLLPSLAVGDTSGVTDEVKQEMRDSGLAHLSAVSGANVTLVCGGVVALLGIVRVRAHWQAIAGGAALVALVVTARPEPSVLRAAVMGVVGLVGLLAGRPGRAPAALGLACLVLLVVDPWLARSFGFTLSVTATAAIVAWGSQLSRFLRHRLPAIVADPLAIAVVAQCAVTPILVLLDPVVTPYAVVANLVVVPVVAPTMLLTSVAAVVALASPSLATWLLWPAAGGALWVAGVADRAAGAPGARIDWPAGVGGAATAAALVIGVVGAVRFLPRRIGPRRILSAGVSAAIVFGLALGPQLLGRGDRLAEDWVFVGCDVGQGQAVLIRTGPDAAIVVDTGPEPRLVTTCLDDAGIRRVDLLVLTHFHADHVGGLSGVVDAARVAQVWHTPVLLPAAGAREALNGLRVAGVATRAVSAGDTTSVGTARVRVLSPLGGRDRGDGHAAENDDGTAINDASVVTRIETPDLAVLVLGDIEIAAQLRLAAMDPALLRADVTTIAHHGSAAQVPGLYARIGATVAVAGVGRGNSYGHPAVATIDMVEATGASVRHSAIDGVVAILLEPPTAGRPRGLRVLTRPP